MVDFHESRPLPDVVAQAPADEPSPHIERVCIDDLGEAGYRILQPIPVEIRRVEIGDFQAWFREANIAMPGSDGNDALQALVAEILETFDVLLSERQLGPDAVEQRRILVGHRRSVVGVGGRVLGQAQRQAIKEFLDGF